MTKYKVTQEFMNELIEWRDGNALNVETEEVCAFVDWRDIQQFPVAVDIWWTAPNSPKEVNARLIAIFQWLNGEGEFEIDEEGNEV